MDPTAPNTDKNQDQQPQAATLPQPPQDSPPQPSQNPLPTSSSQEAANPNPIQPGQFVSSPPEQVTVPPPSMPASPQAEAGPDVVADLPETAPGQFAAPVNPIAGPTSEQSGLNLQTTPPFAPPQPNPAPYESPQQAQEPQGSSKIATIKKVAIVIAVLALLALIFVLLWFFVLGKKPQQASKTTVQTQPVEEPSPPVTPQTTFAQLPQATSEATPSGSLPPTTE